MADEFVKVEHLSPKVKRVNVVFKVVGVEPVKNVRSKRDRTPHAVTEALVGDDTGVILLTLWDEIVPQVKAGQTYKLTNGYISLFKGTLRLNVGKFGTLEDMGDAGITPNNGNNVSMKVYDDGQRGRQYDGFGSGSFWPG